MENAPPVDGGRDAIPVHDRRLTRVDEWNEPRAGRREPWSGRTKRSAIVARGQRRGCHVQDVRDISAGIERATEIVRRQPRRHAAPVEGDEPLGDSASRGIIASKDDTLRAALGRAGSWL